MKKRILFMLLAIVILLAACKPKVEQGALTDTSSQDKVEDKPVDQAQGTGNDPIKSLFEKMGGVIQYKVKYDVVAVQSGETTTYEQTMVIKNKNSRIDMATGEASVSTYMIDDVVYMCTTSDGTSNCFEYPSTDKTAEQSKNSGDTDLRNNYESYKFTPLPSRVIAGATTTCFKYNVELAEMQFCYSNEGVPLYIKATGEGHVNEMTATQYSTTVSDSEFKLPAEPQKFEMPQIPEMPQGYE
jgi:hypothetical protein